MHRPISRRWCGTWQGLAALWLGLCALSSGATEVAHGSRWLAGETAIYVELIRPGQTLDRLLDAPVQKALAALPGYERFYQGEEIKKAVAELEDVAKSLGVTWDQGVRTLTGGGVILAVEGEPGERARVILIVTPTDPAFLGRLNQAILDKASAKARSQGRETPVRSSVHRGLTGYNLGEGQVAYAIISDKLVIADRAKTLKLVADRSLDTPEPGTTLAENVGWKARRSEVHDDAQAWGYVRLDRLRELDPKRFAPKGNPPPPATFLFGAWLETFKTADWAAADLAWTGSGLKFQLNLAAPAGGPRESLKGFVPPSGQGAKATIQVPGTILSLSLWRNLASLWEARAELFPPEVVQGLTKLDGVAGQFFGGRDFGTDVLGALGNDWRLVVASQDHSRLKPIPAMKLPAFALVADLKGDDEDFAQRLKVAFQTFVGLANLGSIQSKSPPLELGSETFEDITISTARFMHPRAAADASDTEPIHPRHNFSPAIARLGNHFIISSTVVLAQDLIHALKTPEPPQSATLMVDADGAELGRIIELNRSRLVMQNMLDKGHDKAHAEREISRLVQLLDYAGRARLTVHDAAEVLRLTLSFDLSR